MLWIVVNRFLAASLLGGILAEFHQSAHRRFRVYEGYVETLGSLAGRLVDQAAAFLLDFSQGVGHSVGHGESYVLDASATAVVGDELGYGAVSILVCPSRKKAVRTF